MQMLPSLTVTTVSNKSVDVSTLWSYCQSRKPRLLTTRIA